MKTIPDETLKQIHDAAKGQKASIYGTNMYIRGAGFGYSLNAKELEEEIKAYRLALEEIQKGKGTYSLDKLTHAGNTINYMKEIATEALKIKP